MDQLEGESYDDMWTRSPPDQGTSSEGAHQQRCLPSHGSMPPCIRHRTSVLQRPSNDASHLMGTVILTHAYI